MARPSFAPVHLGDQLQPRLGLSISNVLSCVTLDNPLAPLGERVAIPQSRESRVRGSAENMIVKNYAGHHTNLVSARRGAHHDVLNQNFR